MTVVTGWDLFEDLRDAQEELLRQNRLRAHGLGQFGQYFGGAIAKTAWAPALGPRTPATSPRKKHWRASTCF